MHVLLLSMPDSFEHTPALAIRMPNGALASLAGNIDAHHDVAIADLILAQREVEPTVERLLTAHPPDVVGLSVMTFQRTTARRIIGFIRAQRPSATIVVGGYDPSLAPEAWIDPRLGVDVIVRGEGDVTFREVLRALERGTPLAAVPGIWYRGDGRMHETAARPPAQLTAGDVEPPRRAMFRRRPPAARGRCSR
jgi:anaerobic magnesium-protoporphyrin IX monomethyl ester cyclase